MRNGISVPVDRLVVLGSKRKWVPMRLWINVIFRFGLYEIWPIYHLFYIPSPDYYARKK